MHRALSANTLIEHTPGAVMIPYARLAQARHALDLFTRGNVVYVHYPRRDDPYTGHWVCLTLHNDTITSFDSYGEWIDEHDVFHTYQLTRLLYDYAGPVHYNSIPLQSYDQTIATCGRWCWLWARLHRFFTEVDHFSHACRELAKSAGISPDRLSVLLTENLLQF